MTKIILTTFLMYVIHKVSGDCIASPTTVIGTLAPQKICSGDLIFEDNFDTLDMEKWQHEQTLGGGGNGEFQWYTNNRSNSYVQDGNLHIKPTFVSDDYGEDFLYSGTIDIGDQCTNSMWNGCSRTGTKTNILNPIKSARLRSLNSFNFKFGKVEVRAKIPAGDWLWPAIWLLPKADKYSYWPTSGEIDVMESRGNRQLYNTAGLNIGVQQMGSTLHWGPNSTYNRYYLTHYEKNLAEGYNSDFHKYQLEWTPNSITFSVDGQGIGEVVPPAGGFWELGNLNSTGLDNPWTNSKMAPFDQEFHLLINLAIGGVNYFPDDTINKAGKKPWLNSDSDAMTNFWKGKKQWLPTWNIATEDYQLKVDYVKVWAL